VLLLSPAGVTALRTTELVQGKTSRWAIAWSFAASPNTANMPLPRRSMPQQQQQHKRAAGSAAGPTKLSFRVTAPAADGRKLLQAIGALLTAVGQAQAVQVDTAAWKVTCQLAAEASKQQQQKDQLCDAEQGPAAKRMRPGHAEAAVGVEAAPGMSRAVSSNAGCSAACANVQVEVSVVQQQRGTFDVVAAVEGKPLQQQQQQQEQLAGKALLRKFEAVRNDLTLMWAASPLQVL
jgi:hypothetical protein